MHLPPVDNVGTAQGSPGALDTITIDTSGPAAARGFVGTGQNVDFGGWGNNGDHSSPGQGGSFGAVGSNGLPGAGGNYGGVILTRRG